MHALDNPIFNALASCQANFAETYGVLRRFPPEVTPLGGFPEPNAEGFAAVRGLLAAGGGLGLFLPKRIDAPEGLEIVLDGGLLQMILEDDARLEPNRQVVRFHRTSGGGCGGDG